MPPDKLALENAKRKALDAASREDPSTPVLGADTVVATEGLILGKPQNEEDARRMLRLLSGKRHFVYTGIALAHLGHLYEHAEKTSVWVAPLTEDEIDGYIKTGEPADKAGAYAVQGIAAKFIPRIEGSFSNVVGLPLSAVRNLLGKAGISV